MKFFISFLLLCGTLFAFEIDERRTDVYYLNGVATHKNTSKSHVYLLKHAVIFYRYGGDETKMNSELSFELNYNTSIDMWSDFVEAFKQYMSDGGLTWTNFWTYLGYLPALATDVLNYFLGFNPGQVHENDIQRHLTKYKNSVLAGHGVALIGHSQGNFFANEAYRLIGQSNDSWMLQYVNVLGLATPASYVAGGGGYSTFDNDPISFIPGGLGANITNSEQTPSEIADKLAFWFKVHQFDYYIKNVTNNILNFVINTKNLHNNRISQWIEKKQVDCGCDKRVILKNRHDETFELPPILEFNSNNGKVYSVEGGYVKASPNGTKVQDKTSTSKDDGICYILEGSGDEPLTTKNQIDPPKEGT